MEQRVEPCDSLAERCVSDGVATGCVVVASVCNNINLIKTLANYLHSIHELVDVSIRLFPMLLSLCMLKVIYRCFKRTAS